MKKILKILLAIIAVIVVGYIGLIVAVNLGGTEESTDSTESSVTWIENYYVDDFDEPTDEKYIMNEYVFSGKFSNSATTDSALDATICVDDKGVGIFLYEYGDDSSVKNSGSYDDEYTITVRNESGKEKELDGAIYPGGDRVMITGEDGDAFIDFLCGEEDIKVSIVNDEYTTTKYLFEVTPDNFAELYK